MPPQHTPHTAPCEGSTCPLPFAPPQLTTRPSPYTPQGSARSLSFVPDAALSAALAACAGGPLAALDLSGCLELSDASVARLGALRGLEQLSLQNCLKIGPEGLRVRGRQGPATRPGPRGCGCGGWVTVRLHGLWGRLWVTAVPPAARAPLLGCGKLTGSLATP